MSNTNFTNDYNIIPTDKIVDNTMIDGDTPTEFISMNNTNKNTDDNNNIIMSTEIYRASPNSIVSEKLETTCVNPIDTLYWKYAYNCERIYTSDPVLNQYKNMQNEYKTFNYECKRVIYIEFTKRMDFRTKCASLEKQLSDATMTTFEFNLLIRQIKDINKEIEESTKKIEQFTHKIEQYQIRIPYICS